MRNLCVSSLPCTTRGFFTDEACNPELRQGSVGGILYDPAGRFKFFGESVPSHIMDALFERSQNPIHELEALPVLLAADMWGSDF